MSIVAALICQYSLGDSPNNADPYAEHVAASGPRTPEEERKGFHLPPGFEIQLVAAEPYVRKPININFDDRGRLWVSESVEYPFAAARTAPHRDTIRILQDTNGDGLADEVTTFTSGLNIPIGVLPVPRGAVVYSIPYVQRFYDTKGDDRADKREVLYGLYGYRDTHGMTGEFTWGFDGWIYACHGYSNTSEVRGADGSKIVMQSGNTYRFKLDGSHVEQMTHGQVNPFGLTWDPLGNLYSCDCHTRPIYQLLRGAFYPSFGKPDDGLGFGPEMMTHDHGSTAIAGITYYAADQFPPEYRDTIFVGNVVTNRINHDRLERHGSTYRAIEQPDFLSSDDRWFRPVDIKLGPDGALYVADFYNRIIGHYEVPLNHPGRDHERGRIWRIVYRGPDGKVKLHKAPPDLGKATVPELARTLAHPNLMVRMKATNQLVERGGQEAVEAIHKLMHGRSQPFQRMHGLWVLERLGALDDATLTGAANDKVPGARVHAMKVLAERKQLPEPVRQLALNALHDSDAFVQRAAADALGTHPAPGNVEPLLALCHVVPADDTHLLYVVRRSLREQLLPAANWARLPTATWSEDDARAIADVAPGVPSAEAAAFLLRHLQKYPEPQANQIRYVYHIARYGVQDTAGALLEYTRGDRAAALLHLVALFKAIQQAAQARGKQMTPATLEWGQLLTRRALASRDDTELLAGVELAGLLRLEAALPALNVLVADKKCSEALRGTAMMSLREIAAQKSIPLFATVLEDAAEQWPLREKAAQLLANTNRPEAQAELLKTLAAAPQRLALFIAVELARSKTGAEKLLDAIAAGKASALLLQERALEAGLSQAKIPDLKDRIVKLTRGLPPADKRFQDLMQHRRNGFAAAKTDPALGAKVFEKHCAVCHTIANKGAKIGPQLDGVGIRGVDRLLEDIIDPNRNVDQAFRLTTLALKNGQLVSGLLLREEGQVYVLADSQGKEVRVTRNSVEERTVSQLSPMPSNFTDQVPEADFYNLLAFLLAQQPAKTTAAAHPAASGAP
jgi:putative heme-binding domain-containing protein